MYYGGLFYMIFYTLDYVIEKTLKQNLTAEQMLLKEITGAQLSKEEALELQKKIDDHKWYVSEKLGRDVGLKVAAVDYLENIYRLKRPSRSNLDHMGPFGLPLTF
jgi:hypothetical protein